MIKIDAFKTTLQTVFSDKKNIIIAGLCVVVIIFAWNVFGSRDNDGRIDAISNDIQQAGDINGQSIEQLGNVANGLDASTERINTSQERIATVQDRITTDADKLAEIKRLIKSGKQLTDTISKRSQSGTD